MKVTYLDHSGFVVDLGENMLVFDYYKGELPARAVDRKLYVFSSHAHYDHFQKIIFDWAEDLDVTYILSDDIQVSAAERQKAEGKVHRIAPRQTFRTEGLSIQTLRSTDEGVAFLAQVDGRTIYHAGDLNWWHWEEESRAYNEMMKRNYQYEIGKIEGQAVDVAFVPLDARQENQYYWGMDYFMKHTDTKVVFPMHMWEHYEVYDWLMDETEAISYKDKVMHITRAPQEFEV